MKLDDDLQLRFSISKAIGDAIARHVADAHPAEGGNVCPVCDAEGPCTCGGPGGGTQPASDELRLPWMVIDRHRVNDADGCSVCECRKPDAQAHIIVTAVNAHSALVAVAEKARELSAALDKLAGGRLGAEQHHAWTALDAALAAVPKEVTK